MTDMKKALQMAGVALTPEEELQEQEEREEKARIKKQLDRPKEEFVLKSITTEEFERKKYQKDPTDDLVPIFTIDSEWKYSFPMYYVWCEGTLQAWGCPSKLCLDANFIYRDDLVIYECMSQEEYEKAWASTIKDVNVGIITRKTCYLLDNPAAETYEVYSDSAFPSLKYGKATPNGMFVHKYDNRFHRDMAIMELDNLYSQSPRKTASSMTKKEMPANAAIIVSDGCWMKNSCSSSYYYMDATCLIKMTQGFLPTEGEQAVLISEIVAATNALMMCYMKKKKNITYYYDNTSILNVLRNRKTEYIQEIVEYKELLTKMDQEGYNVTFSELHPKTGEDNANQNAALMFFHNYCDKECREMSDIFKKDYKDIAKTADSSGGKSYKQAKQEFSKQRKGPVNNQKNGNNKYQRRF